jgi:hypothetical protein
MRRALIAAAALLAALCAPAWAINKCTGPDGKVAFQDAPCSAGKSETLDVRPAAGRAPSAHSAGAGEPPAGVVPKPMTEAQRVEKQVADSQRERRKQELEWRLVPEALAAITGLRKSCDREMQALRVKKASANNNLAGAQWETSISTEMGAVATRCDTRQRELREDADVLRKECAELGGCK